MSACDDDQLQGGSRVSKQVHQLLKGVAQALQGRRQRGQWGTSQLPGLARNGDLELVRRPPPAALSSSRSNHQQNIDPPMTNS